MRSEATLIKEGEGGRERLSTFHRKEISVASFRMERNPLPPLTGHPLAHQSGERSPSDRGNPSEEFVIVKALPPPRHCEERSDVAIQFVPLGA
jgi:hypothetical protein